MLDLIRKKQKSVLVKVMFWLIIATFVGTGAFYLGKDKEGVAAEVNGDPITFKEFRSAYENLRRTYQNVYRDRFNAEMEKQLQLDRQVLEGLISQALLLQEADSLGLKVSKQEVIDAVAVTPYFMRDGKFDMDQYLRVLQSERLSPKQFEKIQRRQMLIEKVRENIEGEVEVTPEEVVEEYRQRNEKINLAFVRLTPALFESKVKVTDEALQKFYQEHREEYRIPEKVALRYVRFDPDRYAKDLELTDKDLEDYYDRHQVQFDVPEQVKVSHILFRADAEAEADLLQKKRQLAEKVLAEIQAKDGKNFAEMARKHSEDAGSAVEGGSLDYFPRGTMVPAFEDVAFSLTPGQISGIVETSFGLHIIKGEGHIEGGVQLQDSVLPAVKEGLTAEKAMEQAKDKSWTAYSRFGKGGDLETVAKEYELKVEETGPFAQSNSIPGIGEAPEATAAAFRLEKGQLSKPVLLSGGFYLLSLKERIESTIPELQEVRQAVEKSYRQAQSGQLAREAAEALLTNLKQGKSLQQLAKGELFKVEETGFFPHSYGAFIPKIGNSAELADKAFELTVENPVADGVYPLGDQFIVARLEERQPADMSKLTEATRQDLSEVLLTREKRALLEGRLAALREKADIRIDPSLDFSLEGE